MLLDLLEIILKSAVPAVILIAIFGPSARRMTVPEGLILVFVALHEGYREST